MWKGRSLSELVVDDVLDHLRRDEPFGSNGVFVRIWAYEVQRRQPSDLEDSPKKKGQTIGDVGLGPDK